MKQGGGAWGGGLLRAGGPLGDLSAGVPADPVSPLQRSWGVPDHPCPLQSPLGRNRGPLAAPLPAGCPHIPTTTDLGVPSVPVCTMEELRGPRASRLSQCPHSCHHS